MIVRTPAIIKRMTNSKLEKASLWMLLIVMLTGLILAGGCSSGQTDDTTQTTSANIAEDVTPEEALTLIQEKQPDPNLVIIDVRTPQEFAGGHIENAINIDSSTSAFREELNKLDRDKTYLIYCYSGTRGSKALSIMEELNFRKVYNISGGITAWQAAGLPVVK